MLSTCQLPNTGVAAFSQTGPRREWRLLASYRRWSTGGGRLGAKVSINDRI